MKHTPSFYLAAALLTLFTASTLRAQSSFYVGSNSSGVTTNFTSGTSPFYNDIFIGFDSTASNNMLGVLNSGTLFQGNQVFVGNAGSSNSMVISNGGVALGSFAVVVGSGAASSNNSVLVTGTGSRISSVSGNVTVGTRGSSNSMVISESGAVVGVRGIIGNSNSAVNNSVLVTGTNSLWTNSNTLMVGTNGAGNSLVISNGGKVVNTTGTIGFANTASNNSVLVTGTNSLWLNSSNLTVGNRAASNSLVISDGGQLRNAAGIIGNSNTAVNNSALVTGAGSAWSNSSTLTVGNSGSGTLTVANGGSIAATGITIAASNGSAGTLNIGRFGTNNTAGTITAPTIAFGLGTGAINLNQSNATSLSIAISGNGTVNQLGSGTTTLSGSNTYSGGTVVSAGSLVGTTTSLQGAITNNAAVTFDQTTSGTYAGNISGSGSLTKLGSGTTILSAVNGYTGATTVSVGKLVVDGSISSSTVTVANGASVAGSGSVGGIVLNLGSTISPGNSPGTLSVAGNVTWNVGGNYNWQIYNTALAAGTGWDLVNATGTLDRSALSVGSEFNVNLWSLSAVGPDVDGSALNFDPSQSYTWTILTAASGITGFSADKFLINSGAANGTAGFANALAGGSFSMAQNGNNLDLIFTAAATPGVPEPGTWAAAALLAGGAAFMCWRKRAKVA